MSEEAILDLRLCDLDIVLEGSPVAERADVVLGELDRRGLKIRPHVWFSDEWACPDGMQKTLDQGSSQSRGRA